MLVLTRKVDEGILIGREIEVFVCGIGPERVKLGVRAPDDVVVLRRELYRRIVAIDPEAAARIWLEGANGWRP